jgi:hypothetical protein
MKDKVLIKDLIIPKGTVFKTVSPGSESKYVSDDYASALFGLTNDTYGEIIYSFDKSISNKQKEKLEEYFVDLIK